MLLAIMLEAVRSLFSQLDDMGVEYCHWKSNDRLADALEGQGDIDLLVNTSQRTAFEATVVKFGYKRVFRPSWSDTPGTMHFYGLDEASGTLIHLHVYFELITGGSILKDHHLRLAPLVLKNREWVQPVPTPSKDIDLALLVLRKMIEFGSPIESVMLLREGSAVSRELKWLAEGNNVEKAADFVAENLPEIDREFFLICAHCLLQESSIVRRMWLGRQMSQRLSRYSLHGPYRAATERTCRLALKVWWKTLGKRQIPTHPNGGSIMAVVGPDATGKSTIVSELKRWLGSEFWVEGAHAGRPPATLLTFIPRLALPFLRRLAPSYRTTSSVQSPTPRRETNATAQRRGLRLSVFVLRAIMIAYERQSLLRRLDRLRTRGAIIISDRYPSLDAGTMDSAQLSTIEAPPNSILGYLADLEGKIYRDMPRPSIVVKLSVPIDVAISRNRNRVKPGKETESYLRERHKQPSQRSYGAMAEFSIDTSPPLEETLRAIKTEVWRYLSVNCRQKTEHRVTTPVSSAKSRGAS